MNTIIKVFVAIALIAAIAVLAVYVMGMFPQTQPYADAAKDFALKAKNYVTDNIPTVIGAGGIVSTFGGVALSQINKAKDKVAEVKESANTVISGVTAEKDKLMETAKTAIAQKETAETELLNLKEQYGNYQTVLDGKDLEIERLKSQLDGLSKLNVDSLSDKVSTQLAEKNRVA